MYIQCNFPRLAARVYILMPVASGRLLDAEPYRRSHSGRAVEWQCPRNCRHVPGLVWYRCAEMPLTRLVTVRYQSLPQRACVRPDALCLLERWLQAVCRLVGCVEASPAFTAGYCWYWPKPRELVESREGDAVLAVRPSERLSRDGGGGLLCRRLVNDVSCHVSSRAY